MAPFGKVVVLGLTSRRQFDHMAPGHKDASAGSHSMVGIVGDMCDTRRLVPVVLDDQI